MTEITLADGVPTRTKLRIRGHRHRAKVRIMIGFDPETFNEVREQALASGESFAERVRTLVEWGLESEFLNSPPVHTERSLVSGPVEDTVMVSFDD